MATTALLEEAAALKKQMKSHEENMVKKEKVQTHYSVKKELKKKERLDAENNKLVVE